MAGQYADSSPSPVHWRGYSSGGLKLESCDWTASRNAIACLPTAVARCPAIRTVPVVGRRAMKRKTTMRSGAGQVRIEAIGGVLDKYDAAPGDSAGAPVEGVGAVAGTWAPIG